jgi:hypothetical protein
VAHGIDPGDLRKAQKSAQTEETETFEVISREWHEKFKSTRKKHDDTCIEEDRRPESQNRRPQAP